MKFPDIYRSEHPLKDKGIVIPNSMIKRFWNFVDKKNYNYCWEWKASLISGYGKLTYKDKNFKAHRISFIIHNGNIPNNLIICHKCNNRKCVNPNHLYAGTYKQNCNDSIKSGVLFKVTSKIGTNHHDSKLKESDVIEIRKSKLNLSELSKKYKVTKQNIIKIQKRKTWKHI